MERPVILLYASLQNDLKCDRSAFVKIVFPLYHGTSSYSAPVFRSGMPTEAWPLKVAAFTFMRDIVQAIRACGLQLEFWEEQTLVQESERSNWQHGEIYLSPSRFTATRYALSNAAFGGELLTMSMQMLERVQEVDPAHAAALLDRHRKVLPMLAGEGQPILLEIVGLTENDLLGEAIDEPPAKTLRLLEEFSRIPDKEVADAMVQQMNFRLKPGCGVIRQAFSVNRLDDSDSRFSYTPLF
jgi:hypothetical protein